MATSKTRSGTTVPKKRVAPTKPEQEKPVALTLKVKHDVYIRLCTLAATQRRTNQAVLLEAVEDYLQRTRA